MSGSRLSGFHRLSVAERRDRLAVAVGLSPADADALRASDALPLDVADAMVENAVGTFELPFGVALNFVVNGHERVIPMVVEEPSVIAAASHAALLARAGGGFVAETDAGAMVGQIQLVHLPDVEAGVARLEAAGARILAAAEALTSGLCRRGAGPRDLEVRVVRPAGGEAMIVVHLLVDTADAMGANAVNSLVEALAPLVEKISGGEARLRVLSNLADRRRARAAVRLPVAALGRDGIDGKEVAGRMLDAYALAATDPYRAATHNKGIMNGIDAVAVATGNDWRALEAGAHAYACRQGSYGPLTRWQVVERHLVGTIELPMAVSTVGPLVASHPRVRLALAILGVAGARALAEIMAAVGLASNLAAMRALVTEGIQKGHLALHARAVSRAAGARGDEAEDLRQRLLLTGEVKLDRARALLRAREARS
jgi:hydroxymethylglutaryl-CoA reductase